MAEVQDALDAYNTDTVREEAILSVSSSETSLWKKYWDICRVCISHIDPISVGITGALSRLERLYGFDTFNQENVAENLTSSQPGKVQGPGALPHIFLWLCLPHG